MKKLKFEASKTAKLFAWFCYAVVGIFHMLLMIIVAVSIGNLSQKSARMKLEMIFSFIVTNTYSALFFAGFEFFIVSIYIRFELINECIM